MENAMSVKRSMENAMANAMSVKRSTANAVASWPTSWMSKKVYGQCRGLMANAVSVKRYVANVVASLANAGSVKRSTTNVVATNLGVFVFSFFSMLSCFLARRLLPDKHLINICLDLFHGHRDIQMMRMLLCMYWFIDSEEKLGYDTTQLLYSL